jgi:hypothetical protein
MRKTLLLTFSLSGLLITQMAVAESDDKYPATNFQPKVIYMDKDADTKPAKSNTSSSKKSSTNSNFDPKYPAAYFEPKVIYP